MTRRLPVFLTSLAVITHALPALAEDQCKDVLLNAPMNVKDFRSESYFQLNQIFALSSLNANESNSGFSVGGVPITASDAQRTLNTLSEMYSMNEIAVNRESYLIYTGQENIIRAWQGCMADRGGLSVNFRPTGDPDDRDIFLSVTYFRNSLGPVHLPDYRLTDDVELALGTDASRPLEITPADRMRCLAAGVIFSPGSECKVRIRVPSAWSTLAPIFHLVEIGATGLQHDLSAFLPPRAVLRWGTPDEMVWPNPGSPRVWAGTYYGPPPPQRYELHTKPGYTLLTRSISIGLISCVGATGRVDQQIDPNGKYVVVYVIMLSTTDNPPGLHTCDAHVNGTQVKPEWYPPRPKQ